MISNVAKKESKKKYHIFLILTDGEPNDMDAIKAQLVKSSE